MGRHYGTVTVRMANRYRDRPIGAARLRFSTPAPATHEPRPSGRPVGLVPFEWREPHRRLPKKSGGATEDDIVDLR